MRKRGERRRRGGAAKGSIWVAVTLAMCAGAATGVFSIGALAQQGGGPSPMPPPPSQRPPSQPLQDPAAELQRRNEERRREREALEGRAAPVANGQPLVSDPPAPGVGALAGGEGTVVLNFPDESVEISAFADYVSRALGVNIYVDEGVAGQRILFKAPLEVPVSRLLPLLSAFVEDRGYALVKHPLGWYHVQPAANVMPFLDGDGLATTRIIQTPLVKPSALQAAIQTALGGQQSVARITPLDELGALMITGTPRTVDSVASIVDRLLQEVAGQRLVRFPVLRVSADYARTRIVTLNGQIGAGTVPGVPAPGGGAAPVGSLSNLDSRLFVDQGNTLVFRGTPEEARQVADLLAMVDEVTALTAKRYTIGTIVEEVARAGEKMGLGPVTYSQQSGSGGFGSFSGGLRPSQPGLGFQQPDSEVSGSHFTVDAETGSFNYFGNSLQHEIVAQLVKDFTEQQISARVEIRMYKLHNARAESVADLLNELVQDPSRRLGTSPFLPASRQQTRATPIASQLGSQPTQADTIALEPGPGPQDGGPGGVAITATAEEVSIVADVDRNQVIIRAPARMQAEFDRIIKVLDERQRQVYIEAQIVAVRTNDNFTWTVETQINAGEFLIFSNFGLSVPQVVDGQPTGPKQVPAGNRGVTAAVVNSDYVPFIINTLQTNADARIVSNPRLLVMDNESGTVSSERDEPFAVTSQGTATTTTGQGGVASAGTALEVTPRISEGGYLTLEFEFELSNFDRTVAQAQGLQPPTQRERYSSTVQVPTDSTIVVGGFTLASYDESESGIPLLKDIPLIGSLFKSYSRNRTNTTIFLFITPTILSDPNSLDLRLVSDGPMREMLVEDRTPTLEPVVIPISVGDLAVTPRTPRTP